VIRRLSGKVFSGAAFSLLFFVLYYLYLWLVVDLRLIYHGGGMILNFPVFYLGREFFRQTVSLPGGFVDYISAFLAQFFHIGWAGALIATMQAYALWLCTRSIARVSGPRLFEWVSFVSPILLLILYLRYAYPLGIAMDLLAALSFACLYIKAASRNRPTSIAAFLLLSIILYAIAGGIYLLFAAICGLHELLLMRRPAIGVILLLSAPIIAFIESTTVFKMSFINVFNDFIQVGYKGEISYVTKITTAYLLYLFMPMILVVLWLVSKMRFIFTGRGTPAGAPSKANKKNKQDSEGRLIVWFKTKVLTTLAPSAAIVAGILAVCFFHNSWNKTLIAVDYYASNKMWQQVLDVAHGQPYSIFINHAVNRALYHTNRLTQDMFVYKQQPDGLMLSKESATPMGWWRLADTYIDLGHMNLAEISLNEVMDLYGEQPLFSKRLALVGMVKGDIASARVYLDALSRTLFDAEWAKEQLKKIESDPNLSTDGEIQRLRSMKPVIDRDLASLNENIFLDLLTKNKNNRMAFEYLEAFYLLTDQLDKFVKHLELLNNYDYAGIPRVYEEAILLYNSKTKEKLEISGREINADSRRRFDNFIAATSGGLWTNKYKLRLDYGDSYFYYYNSRQSGR